MNLVMSIYEFMYGNLQGWAGLDELGAGGGGCQRTLFVCFEL